jgi:hypothetical protein
MTASVLYSIADVAKPKYVALCSGGVDLALVSSSLPDSLPGRNPPAVAADYDLGADFCMPRR